MKIQILAFVFLLLIQSVAAFWMSLPSASSGCDSWTSDKFHWDDEDDDNHNSWGGTIPRGNYGHDTDIYFCTGTIDTVPFGSYCFPQNRQNCKTLIYKGF